MEAGRIGDEKPTICQRFVILWHALPSLATIATGGARCSHFDLMFEASERLVTFELPRIPIPGERIPLVRLVDHRRDFLEFEGKLSPAEDGSDRGHVTRWAAGSYHFFRRTREKQIVELDSDRFSARLVLKPRFSLEDLAASARSPSLDWAPIDQWEMYVPRWSLREKSCSKA
jgi:hypothetical protein